MSSASVHPYVNRVFYYIYTDLPYTPRPLELQLPPTNRAIRDARLLFDGLFIAAGLQQALDGEPLLF